MQSPSPASDIRDGRFEVRLAARAHTTQLRYALYRKNKLYYVGLATNLRGRLNTHLKDRHKGLWDRFSVYLTLENSHLRELEALVIRVAQPKGNKQRGKFARSENLVRMLRRHVRDEFTREMRMLTGDKRAVGRKSAPRQRRGRPRKGDRPLAMFADRVRALRAVHRGKLYKARVRKNGTIRVGAAVFDSPSLAAVSIVGRAKNGWDFWKYQRTRGVWVPLNELRSR